MNIKMLKAAVAGLVLSVSGFANAGMIVFTDEASWLAATSSVTTIDFNTGSDQVGRGSNYTESGVTFSADSVYSIYDIDYDASYHDTGYLDMEGSNLGMDFGSDITALGFYFGAFYDNEVSMTFDNGQVFNLSAPTSQYSFFGLVSDDSFNSVTMNTANAFTAFDNVSFGDAAEVPEPSTLAIFALGVLGLASRRFKKQ
jgi:hypothetical protein